MVKDPAKLREERFILAYGLAVHHGEVILGVVEGAWLQHHGNEEDKYWRNNEQNSWAGGGGYALSDGGHHSVIWKLGVFIM